MKKKASYVKCSDCTASGNRVNNILYVVMHKRTGVYFVANYFEVLCFEVTSVFSSQSEQGE